MTNSSPPAASSNTASRPVPLAAKKRPRMSRWHASASDTRPKMPRMSASASESMMDCELSLQRLVADAMRPIGLITLAPAQILHVLVVVALEHHDLAVAFEREDVGRDAIEEPAIVRDHDGAAREG